MACAPSEDSDQPGHPPSLIRVFAVRMKKAWVLSYPMSAQRRLWSDWADAQADLSLRWAHSLFVGFVMRRLKCSLELRFYNPISTAAIYIHVRVEIRTLVNELSHQSLSGNLNEVRGLKDCYWNVLFYVPGNPRWLQRRLPITKSHTQC